MLPLHDEAHLEPLNLYLVISRRVSLDLIMEAGGDDPRTHGQLALFCVTFFKQLRPNRTVISLPCSSFQIGASRSLRIVAPLCFLSGSVRSIHDRSWIALLTPSSIVSACSSDFGNFFFISVTGTREVVGSAELFELCLLICPSPPCLPITA